MRVVVYCLGWPTDIRCVSAQIDEPVLLPLAHRFELRVKFGSGQARPHRLASARQPVAVVPASIGSVSADL